MSCFSPLVSLLLLEILVLGMLANTGTRNLAGSRAAGGTGALEYVITHPAPLWAAGVRAGSLPVGYSAPCEGFCCSKGSALRETEFDCSYILASLMVSGRTGKQPKAAPAEHLAPHKNSIMPPSLCPSAACPWQWGLTCMHKGTQGRMTQGGSARQLLCFRFQQ